MAATAALAATAVFPALALASPGGSPGALAGLTANPDCTLRVPADPLTAQGLATPYVLGSAGTGCAEDESTGAFVQATVLNPATGALSVYDPEVTVPGETGDPVPPVPALPRGAVVAIWTGFNGNELKLTGPGAGQFVNFAQQAYDNSPAFFAALRQAVALHRVTVPPAGTASDGRACPTTRDPSVVDQDPNDNVPVTYAYGAQASNGSDEQLVDLVLQALGCREWLVPLLDPGVAQSSAGTAAVSPSGLLQEEQASIYQRQPLYVPGNDEFTTSDGNFVPPNGDGTYDPYLNNLYREQVGQPPAFANQTLAFCWALAGRGAPRLAADFSAEAQKPAPVFAQIGANLALVLGARFEATWGNLGCPRLTGRQSPLMVTGSPAATAETYYGQPLGGTGSSSYGHHRHEWPR